MALAFSKVLKEEVYGENGKLQWSYVSHATVDNKPAGSIRKATLWECQQEIDHYTRRPDKWISKAMSEGSI